MANTYSQVYLQLVFVVQHRDCVIRKSWQDELYKYMTGIVRNHEHKLLAIGGMPDHVHLFIGLKPSQSISELVQNVKRDSSAWINDNKLSLGRFSWQSGFGVFSYSRSHIDRVVNYILNQETHHKKFTFLEEYISFLKRFGIEYDPQYIFKEVGYKY